MFEFAFMPIALRCAQDANQFKSLFTVEVINHFFNSFFYTPPQSNIRPLWKDI